MENADNIAKADTEPEIAINHAYIDNETCEPTTSTFPTSLARISPSSSTTSLSLCRICQLPFSDQSNTLISPCRCSGSIRFVHTACLGKWLEVLSSSKTSSPSCEICHYQYKRHKQIRLNKCKLPSCSRKDKILHLILLISILMMLTCFALLVVFSNKSNYPKPAEMSPDITTRETLTLLGGVFLFITFFVAMYAAGTAEQSPSQLFWKCIHLNQNWTIEEFDKSVEKN